jgi:GntR family transcriptional regulator
MITVDFRSRVPIYEQIKNSIKELTLIGALKPHDQLPSVRALAVDLQINFNTVKKAFGDLETEGVIYTLAGRGCFIAENPLGSTGLRQKAEDDLRLALASSRVSGLTRDEILKMVDELYSNQEA